MEDKAGMGGGREFAGVPQGNCPLLQEQNGLRPLLKTSFTGKRSEILQHNLKSMKGCLRAITLSLAPLF